MKKYASRSANIIVRQVFEDDKLSRKRPQIGGMKKTLVTTLGDLTNAVKDAKKDMDHA